MNFISSSATSSALRAGPDAGEVAGASTTGAPGSAICHRLLVVAKTLVYPSRPALLAAAGAFRCKVLSDAAHGCSSGVQDARGRTGAHLLEADDGNCYVVKFRNNPQHHRVLVNELLVASFLDYLKITATESAVIQVTAEFLAANPAVQLTVGSSRIAVE